MGPRQREPSRTLIVQATWTALAVLMDTIAVSHRVGGCYVHPQDGTYLLTVYVE
jgi:hypothetical protein